ncbi:MAG: hypothetical protein QNI84_07275 [Henriciella sp.]|nr:hypothetical protein [Henriciella sp.]
MLRLVRSSLAASLTTICFAAWAQNGQLPGTWQCQSKQSGEFWEVEVEQTITYAMNSLFRSKTIVDFVFFDARNDISYVVEGTGDYYLTDNNLCTKFQDLSVTAIDLSDDGTSTDEELRAEADWYRSEILKSDICSAKIINIAKYRMIIESINGMKFVCAKKGGLS